MSLDNILDMLETDITTRMTRSGIMFRIFSRVKSVDSLRHKVNFKSKKYLEGKAKIQDMLGMRIVLYFPDDVEALSAFLGNNDVVKRAIDEHDISTFCPQRLNLTKNIPEEYVEEFRKGLPEDLAQFVDNTYEIQIRTIFSEGWHEVEHDMRYKCKQDWVGCEQNSRTLNGMIATLETVEWGMESLFQEMAQRNFQQGNYRAMLRNKMRLRFANNDFSERVTDFLSKNRDVAEQLLNTDRIVLILSMLNREDDIPLTFDNVLFLANKIDIMNKDLMELESN